MSLNVEYVDSCSLEKLLLDTAYCIGNPLKYTSIQDVLISWEDDMWVATIYYTD